MTKKSKPGRKRGVNYPAMLRALVPEDIKARVDVIAKSRMSNEGQIVREAVLKFLKEVEAA